MTDMHANIEAPSADTAPTDKPLERLILVPYLFLRVFTAGGAVVMGFVQTFVFARVLTPERFSIFIVVGAIGYTLWLVELGFTNILFVDLRRAYLAGGKDERAARQATAVILFYATLAIAASLVCFILALAQPLSTLRGAFELALFLLYITLNLAWTSLRSISIAIDQFIFFERLELVRRILNIATLLAIVGGLPLVAFLIGSNALWGILFTAASAKLLRRGALFLRPRDFLPDLVSFFRLHRNSIARSSTSALSGAFIALFPYYIVPMWFGLGAAPIILEVTFRIYRGACVLFTAICDLAIPGQTRALAGRDVGRLVRATLLVAGLCCVPAAIAGVLLIFAGGPLFTFLLRSAANVPPAISFIVVVLLLASILQIVSETLLQYTGYFRSLAYNGAAVAAAMVMATLLVWVARLDLVGFLATYAAVYAAGAIALAIAAVCGPIRAAAVAPDQARPISGVLRTIRNAPPTQPATPDRQDIARKIPQPTQNP
jgi:O-antigen/teichoic acid export membrane protein